MIGGIGMPELIVILVIILIIFGAGKLPEIGSGLAKAIRNFKGASDEVDMKPSGFLEGSPRLVEVPLGGGDVAALDEDAAQRRRVTGRCVPAPGRERAQELLSHRQVVLGAAVPVSAEGV